jgi:molybdopterin-guanine dinucleotide biosynthesis protein A
VLAGGLSRRFGGADKAFVKVGEAAIIARVIARLKPQCERLAINANGDLTRFSGFGLPVVSDPVPDLPGPLAGVLAGLDFAAAAHCAWIVTVPSDCPFLPRDLVARLHHARTDQRALLACAQSGGRRHPVIALWPVALRDALRRAIHDDDVRKVDRFTARYQTAAAIWPDTPSDPFFNVNTPDDAVEANRIAARVPEL